MANVIWQPQPRQEAFMRCPCYEALYGGAAGGGKSDALLAEALRQVHIPHYRAIIFRKTYPELSELIDRSQEIYPKCFPKSRYNDSKHFWRFPSGAKIYFGAMQHTRDRTKYQGKRYDFIGFDELTHFGYDEYSYMFSRNRPSGKGTRVYIRATTNPGGIGHGWVKQRFITAAPPMTKIIGEYSVETPDGVKTLKRSRMFIPATVFDNQRLLENDPMYIANLAMLPEAEKQALLYGSWDSFDGQVFKEWVNDPAHYIDRKWTHVVEPFMVPTWWNIYRGFDFGYSRPFSVGWYAVAPPPDGTIYRIGEYYGCTGTANVGVQMNPVEIAAQIRRIENEDPNLKGRHIIGIADPAIFEESHGESIAHMMEKSPNFITFGKGDHARIAGKMQFHYRFAFGDDGRPKFQVFNTCTNFIRTIPNLVYDDKWVEDINTEQEDHIYDECRYVLMENPISPRENKMKPVPKSDPLNIYKDSVELNSKGKDYIYTI